MPPLNFQFICGLPAHLKSVNVVRWSPDGSILATGSDDGTICIWRQHAGTPPNHRWSDVRTSKDLSRQFLRAGASAADVYDIAWAPDSSRLLAGSINNAVHIWSAKSGALLQTHVVPSQIKSCAMRISSHTSLFATLDSLLMPDVVSPGFKIMPILSRGSHGTHTTNMLPLKAATEP